MSFDPLTLAIGAGALAAGGSFMQSRNQAKALSNAAKVQETNAATARAWGAQEGAAARREAARLTGRQTAAAGATGLAITGSLESLLTDEAIEGELQALNLEARREQEARNFEYSAASSRAQAKGISRLAPLTSIATGVTTGLSVYGAAGGFGATGPSLTESGAGGNFGGVTAGIF